MFWLTVLLSCLNKIRWVMMIFFPLSRIRTNGEGRRSQQPFQEIPENSGHSAYRWPVIPSFLAIVTAFVFAWRDPWNFRGYCNSIDDFFAFRGNKVSWIWKSDFTTGNKYSRISGKFWSGICLIHSPVRRSVPSVKATKSRNDKQIEKIEIQYFK